MTVSNADTQHTHEERPRAACTPPTAFPGLTLLTSHMQRRLASLAVIGKRQVVHWGWRHQLLRQHQHQYRRQLQHHHF